MHVCLYFHRYFSVLTELLPNEKWSTNINIKNNYKTSCNIFLNFIFNSGHENGNIFQNCWKKNSVFKYKCGTFLFQWNLSPSKKLKGWYIWCTYAHSLLVPLKQKSTYHEVCLKPSATSLIFFFISVNEYFSSNFFCWWSMTMSKSKNDWYFFSLSEFTSFHE